MFVLIVSRDLKILFSTLGGTFPFHTLGNAAGQPLSSAKALLTADPDLIDACNGVLAGGTVAPREIGEGTAVYVRRIILRDGAAGAQADEIIITYQPGPLAPLSEIVQLRSRLTQAVEAQSDAIAYFDAADRLTMCNNTFANMHLGPEGPVTVGMTFEEILRRDLRHGMLALPSADHEGWIKERLAERAKPYLTKKIYQRDGRVFRLIERQTLDGGRVNLMVDITELERMEQRLREVIDGVAFGTFEIDLATDSLDLDARAAQMLGYGAHDFRSIPAKTWRAMIHPADIAAFDTHRQGLIGGHIERVSAQFRMLHRDGHWVWLQTHGGLSNQNAEGQPTRLTGIQLDISAQKHAEADLSLRATAITAASDGIVITDAEGQILDCNPAFATMLAHDAPAVLLGMTWPFGFDIDASPLSPADLHRVLRTQNTWIDRVTCALHDAAHDAATVEMDLSMTRMPDGRLVWIARDVGARNALERERLVLRESVGRAHRQEMVNLLAAGLTHDLSNLTALIATLSDPATKGFAKGSTDVMDEIHSAARQMVALLEPIKNLGRRKAVRECTDLGALLSEAAGILQLGAPTNLKIYTHRPPEPIQAELDPMQLMQVLLNLGLNARDALGEGSNRIDLSLRIADQFPAGVRLETGTMPDAPFALFRIKDSGSGISPEIRSKIWEPFFTTKKLSGTGLGLFVVADIVRSVGGAIAVHSEVDKGTCFFIAWPLVRVSRTNAVA